MDKRNNDFDFDFTPIGQAIKNAREKTGMTREQLARIVDYDPRHLQAVENEGSIRVSSCSFSLLRCSAYRWTSTYSLRRKSKRVPSADA